MMSVEEALARIDKPGPKTTITYVAAQVLAAEVRRLAAELDGANEEVAALAESLTSYQDAAERPNLGLASTRELLEELQARVEVATTVDPRDGLARLFTRSVRELLNDTPDRLLDYRTVEGT